MRRGEREEEQVERLGEGARGAALRLTLPRAPPALTHLEERLGRGVAEVPSMHGKGGRVV